MVLDYLNPGLKSPGFEGWRSSWILPEYVLPKSDTESGRWLEGGAMHRVFAAAATLGALAVVLTSGMTSAQTCLAPGDILVAQPDAAAAYGAITRIDPVTGAHSFVAVGSYPEAPTFDNLFDVAVEANGMLVAVGTAPVPHVSRVDPTRGEVVERVTCGGELGSPQALAVESDGGIIVADPISSSADIVRVDPAGTCPGTQTVVMDAPSGDLFFPHQIARERDGTLLVAQRNGPGGLFRVDPNTGGVTPIWSSGSVKDVDVALDGSIVFGSGNVLYRLDPVTLVATTIGDLNGTPAQNFVNFAVERDGGIVLTQPFSSATVHRFDPLTGLVAELTDLGGIGDTAYGITVVDPQCDDGLDNDSDGDVDFPEDADCEGLEDATEFTPFGEVGPARGNLLANGGFETPEDMGAPDELPVHLADWVGHPSAIVGAENGLEPTEGSSMLRLGTPTGFVVTDPPYFVTYEIHQLVDLSPFRVAVDAGRLRLRGYLQLSLIDSLFEPYGFSFRVRSYAGHPEGLVSALTPVPCSLADQRPGWDWNNPPGGYWESIEREFLVPPGSEFLLVTLGASALADDYGNGDLFDWVYLDEVALRVVECDDGLDNDGDGLIDIADDGCADADDRSENGAETQCDDGVDNDGDGAIDERDLGCREPGGREDPACQDGLDNDGDGLIDFDGGQSIIGICGTVCPAGVSDPDGDGVANPDPQCIGKPWKNREAKRSSCGFGVELAFLLGPVMWLHRRRRD